MLGIFIVVIGLICFLLGYYYKKRKDIQIDKSTLKEYESEVKAIENKITLKNAELKSQEEKLQGLKFNFDTMYNLQKENLENKLKEEQARRISEIEKNIQELDKKLQEDFNKKVTDKNKEIEKLQEELQKYYEIRQTIIEEQIREEEKRNKINFYKIVLRQTEKEDIERLKDLIPKLSNKEILAKLIWSTYYQKPYKDLVNRVIGTEKICGIYKITNLQNGRAYIGQSTDIATRWSNHLKTSLGIDACAHSQIHDALNSDGIENFTFEVLEKTPREQLNEKEKYYIGFYDTTRWGYNVTKGNN